MLTVKSSSSLIILLILSVILAVLIVLASLIGISSVNFYQAESFNWQVQSVGQDAIDLTIIAPVLTITAFLRYRGFAWAGMIWAGVISYIIYTFTIYCFAVHFNKLFLVYCLILGISFYSLIYFICSQYSELTNQVSMNTTVSRI